MKVVASGGYLAARGTPQTPAELVAHDALIYSTVQGDARWNFTSPEGRLLSIPVKGPLRSNSLSALLATARSGMGVAALPRYVAEESLKTSAVTALLTDWTLSVQEIHAVFSSPRLVSAKVSTFVAWLQGAFGEAWWTGPVKSSSA